MSGRSTIQGTFSFDDGQALCAACGNQGSRGWWRLLCDSPVIDDGTGRCVPSAESTVFFRGQFTIQGTRQGGIRKQRDAYVDGSLSMGRVRGAPL